MRRGLWFAAGAGAGVYAVVRARRLAEWATGDGLRDRFAGLAVGLRIFGEEVRAGAAEREIELRERLALAPDGQQALHRALSARPAARTGEQTNEQEKDE